MAENCLQMYNELMRITYYSLRCETLNAHRMQFLFIKNSFFIKVHNVNALHKLISHCLEPLAEIAFSVSGT